MCWWQSCSNLALVFSWKSAFWPRFFLTRCVSKFSHACQFLSVTVCVHSSFYDRNSAQNSVVQTMEPIFLCFTITFWSFSKTFFRICLYALFCNCFLPADLYVKIQRKQLCCGCWPATVNESKYCSLLILWREIPPASRQSSTTRIAAPWEIYGIRSGLLDISDSHSCFRFPFRSWYFWSS